MWVNRYFTKQPSPKRHEYFNLILTGYYSATNQMVEHTKGFSNSRIRVLGLHIIVSHMITFSSGKMVFSLFFSSLHVRRTVYKYSLRVSFVKIKSCRVQRLCIQKISVLPGKAGFGNSRGKGDLKSKELF